MSLSFPLSLDSFFAGLPVTECEFHLPATLATSRTRGGTVLTARVSERLWTGKVTLAPQRHRDAAGIEAKVSALLEPGRSFLAHPLPFHFPQADPHGAGLDGYAPVLCSIEAGGRELSIAGLPGDYVLSPGDFLSFAYGTNPTRYGLHQVVTATIANSAGLTPKVEVTPAVRQGANAGTAVTFVRPFIKAILLPPPSRRFGPAVASGLSFDFVQTLG